jgi:ornithine cyclodeaminase/alanine dehydrogenase-like protein (mu-crystallin family)
MRVPTDRIDPRSGSATLLLTGREVGELLGIDACIDAVERAFGAYGRREVPPPAVLGVHVEGGGFHVKAASLSLGRAYFVAKLNANFPGNPERFGFPTIQGVVALFDAECGRLLALIDSGELTSMRTAAATAVAAKYLARHDSTVVTICGCGEQGRAQLRALSRVLPIRTAIAVDSSAPRAERYATDMSAELGIAVRTVRDLREAVLQSDVCVTCTTARTAILRSGDVPAGAFVAAVGADNPEKQEVEPALMAESTVVADVVDQCAQIGDLHHAIVAGAMTRADVHAELGEIVAGMKPGRRSESEIIIFDSTGTALQDAAAASVVYENAVRSGKGASIDFRGPPAGAA